MRLTAEGTGAATAAADQGDARPGRPVDSATSGRDPATATVAAVITTYNHAHFLGEALDSILAQTRAVDEIIVVDDGSKDDPEAVTRFYPGVRLIRQANQGLSAARNTGLEAATSDLILFLDADDWLRPQAVAAGLSCLRRWPQSAMVYGGYELVRPDGSRIGHALYRAIGSAPFVDFLSRNMIGMHAAVLYRREALVEVGGYDVTLRRCEDYDLYLRMSRRFPVASHPNIIAGYRWHGANMSSNFREMLDWVVRVHARYKPDADSSRIAQAAWKAGRQGFHDYYGEQILSEGRREWRRSKNIPRAIQTYIEAFRITPYRTVRGSMRLAMNRLLKALPADARGKLKRVLRSSWPTSKAINFGDLGEVQPISDEFGYDRGEPVDRGYIEAFLNKNRSWVKGVALEIGDDEYSRKFSDGKITKQDILHVREGNPIATIIGDISDPTVLADDTYDVIVLTQTLHLIYDMAGAVKQIYRALKPGGGVLLTVPGITRVDRGEWGYTWYWSLTELSASKVMAEAFSPDDITVEVYGNVYAATAFLQGLALEEVDADKLAVSDSAFPVIIGVRAQKGQ